MKLALSCRVAESSSRKDVAALPIDELIPLARAAGFAGLSMRAPAVCVDTPAERVRAIRELLDSNALRASMVMGNVALAANNAHARRAADEAAERGITLAHQPHWGTLCETVQQTLTVLRKIDHPHFGVTFEPANLLACGDDYGAQALKQLAPYLVNFYLQNVRLDAKGAHTFRTRTRGPVALRYVELDDPRGHSYWSFD
jgi:sugar phosphate isomerase/epimerase